MDASKQNTVVSFEEAILKAKVAQICDSLGFHAITQDSSNILVDIYRRTIHHLARHCKDAANNNQRVEPTIIDLIQAYDFVGISIPSLKEHIETVKLPLDVEITQSQQKPSNRIQRNLLVDDLLEAEKNSHLEEPDEVDNKPLSDVEEDEKPAVPLLKDTYQQIASKFTDCQPVTADKKIRLGGRILLVNSTKLKISTPLPPEPVPSTSGGDTTKLGKKKKKKEVEKRKISKTSSQSISPVKQSKGRGRGKGKKKRKLSKEFVLPEEGSPEKEKLVLKDEPVVVSQEVEDVAEKEKEEKVKVKTKTKTKTKAKDKDKEKEKVRANKKAVGRKAKVADIPVDPPIEEPEIPLAPPEVEIKHEPELEESTSTPPKPIKEAKGKRKKRTSDELPIKPESTSPKEVKEFSKTKGPGRKKIKLAVAPLDPSIAEPPSFLPILEAKNDEVIPEEKLVPPIPSTTKQPKSKKKKKPINQFAIVTETVTATEEKEWFCPACGGPDDGDLMVQCDACQEWYHLGCTNLTKPPEDDERWECDICINKSKAKAELQKRPKTPVEIVVAKKEKITPEPVIITPPPPPAPAVVVPNSSGTSQDDLCPECNLPDDGTMMIQCDDPFCAKWFHGKCVNLLEEPKEDESWFCKVCVDKQQSAFKRRRRAK